MNLARPFKAGAGVAGMPPSRQRRVTSQEPGVPAARVRDMEGATKIFLLADRELNRRQEYGLNAQAKASLRLRTPLHRSKAVRPNHSRDPTPIWAQFTRQR